MGHRFDGLDRRLDLVLLLLLSRIRSAVGVVKLWANVGWEGGGSWNGTINCP